MNNAMKNPKIAKKCGLARRRSVTIDGILYGDYKQAAIAIKKSPSYVLSLIKKDLAKFGERGSGF